MGFTFNKALVPLVVAAVAFVGETFGVPVPGESEVTLLMGAIMSILVYFVPNVKK